MRLTGGYPLLLFGLVIALAGWHLWPKQESTWERIHRSGAIRIGYSLEAPYAFRDARGRVTGEAPEVARAVLARMGVKHIEWVHAEFATLIPKLKSGRFDIIATGMYPTPERLREIAFSRPSFCVGSGFLVLQGNPKSLHNYADLAGQKTARLAVLAGAVEGVKAQQLGVPGSHIVAFPDADSAARGILLGVVDALALSGPSVRYLAREWPGLEAVGPKKAASGRGDSPRDCGAFGFRRQDDALREAFDRQLRQFLGSEEHLRLVHPLGFTPRNLPGWNSHLASGDAVPGEGRGL
jgi:polar amino acid transport system substrate-binding protein